MSLVKPVESVLGEIHGRDAILLEEFQQKGMRLLFRGEINGAACRQAPQKKNMWLRYELEFGNVLAYDCRELDICTWYTNSSFDEIVESTWLVELNLTDRLREFGLSQCHHYILTTYDFVYQVAATHFDLRLLAEREKTAKGARKS